MELCPPVSGKAEFVNKFEFLVLEISSKVLEVWSGFFVMLVVKINAH